MALPQDSQFYQASGADSGFTAADRRKFSYGQLGSPHELVNPIIHMVGGLVLSGADAFAYASGAVSPFTFDEYGRVKTDTQLVLSGGDIQIGAVEIKDATEATRMNVGVDASGLAADPGIMSVGGEYRASDTTYTDGDAAILQADVNGKLRVTEVALSGLAVTRNADLVALSGLSYTTDLNVVALSGLSYTSDLNLTALSGLTVEANEDLTAMSGLGVEISANTARIVPPYNYSSARGDFSAAYTSTTTITLTGTPFTITNEDLAFIRVTDTAGTTTTVFVNGVDGVSLSISSNVITITGAGTPFASGDTYEVGLNGQQKAYDSSLDVNKAVEQSPLWSRYVTEHALDLGSATAPSSVDVNMDGYQNISMQIEMGSPAGSLWILPSNDGTNFQNWTGSISIMGGLNNTLGSVFLTTDNFLAMTNVGIDTLRFTVSGAPTTTDIYTKRWY